eukprot:7218841-Pyramimonas_sp.AAC.1
MALDRAGQREALPIPHWMEGPELFNTSAHFVRAQGAQANACWARGRRRRPIATCESVGRKVQGKHEAANPRRCQ